MVGIVNGSIGKHAGSTPGNGFGLAALLGPKPKAVKVKIIFIREIRPQNYIRTDKMKRNIQPFRLQAKNHLKRERRQRPDSITYLAKRTPKRQRLFVFSKSGYNILNKQLITYSTYFDYKAHTLLIR